MTTLTHESTVRLKRERIYRCRQCTLRHSPACPAPGPWPLAPLLVGVSCPAKTFSASASQLAKYAVDGLPDHVADRWAYKAGHHPSHFWGMAWFDAGLTVVDRAFVEGTAASEPGWRPAVEYRDLQRFLADVANWDRRRAVAA